MNTLSVVSILAMTLRSRCTNWQMLDCRSYTRGMSFLAAVCIKAPFEIFNRF